MCTVFLPPGDNPIAVNKYIISYHIIHLFTLPKKVPHKISKPSWISICISYKLYFGKSLLRTVTNLGCARLKADLLRRLQNSGTWGFGRVALGILKDFSAFTCTPSSPRPWKLGLQTLRNVANYVLSYTTSHSTKFSLHLRHCDSFKSGSHNLYRKQPNWNLKVCHRPCVKSVIQCI